MAILSSAVKICSQSSCQINGALPPNFENYQHAQRNAQQLPPSVNPEQANLIAEQLMLAGEDLDQLQAKINTVIDGYQVNGMVSGAPIQEKFNVVFDEV